MYHEMLNQQIIMYNAFALILELRIKAINDKLCKQ